MKDIDCLGLSHSKYLVTSFIDFSICSQLFTSLPVYCHLSLQNIEDLTNNVYPKNDKLRDQKHFKTYASYLFEVGQEVHRIYHSLNDTKLQFDSCLNHLTRGIVTKERTDLSFGRASHVKYGFSHKAFNFLMENQMIKIL